MNAISGIVLLGLFVCIANQSPDIVTAESTAEANAKTNIGDSSSTAISSSIVNNRDIFELLDGENNTVVSGLVDDIFPSPVTIDSPTFINPNSEIIVGNCLTQKWTTTNQQAIDIAVSPLGDLYSVGIDGRLFHYNYDTNQWMSVINSKETSIFITRIAVDTNGDPYIVTQSGDTYYHSCNGNWVHIPGCAIDIAIGSNGDVFKIGCDKRKNGYSIYKLMCKDEEEKKSCDRYKRWWRCSSVSQYKEESNCSWFKVDGSGVRVAVTQKGNPVVITIEGDILSYDGESWNILIKGANARDIDISNEGDLYYTDASMKIYKIKRGHSTPVQVCGLAKAVTVGPLGHPFIISNKYLVLASSKNCFN